jgi:hypothetical protein
MTAKGDLSELETDDDTKCVSAMRPAAKLAIALAVVLTSPLRGIKWASAVFATTIWLTRNASADELERALAEWSYFGRGAYGIKAAKRAWFGCEASPTIAQDALLIGLLQSPNRPYEHRELMRNRRLHTLESFAAIVSHGISIHSRSSTTVQRECAQSPATVPTPRS